jgi:hypothetical protein
MVICSKDLGSDIKILFLADLLIFIDCVLRERDNLEDTGVDGW